MIGEFLNNYCFDGSIKNCLQGIYNLSIALAVVIAFIFFILGAFKNLVSNIPDIKLEGKRQMVNALFGLFVIFLSGIILYWINPFIFNPILIIYKVSQYTVPSIITTETKSYNVRGTTYNIEIAKLKNEEEIDGLTECQGGQYKVRMTTYYIPIYEEEGNTHSFLSNVTLQGTGIIKLNDKLLKINYTKTKEILNNLKGRYALAQCKNKWAWSWIGYQRGETAGCDNNSTKNTSQKHSIKEIRYNENQALSLIQENARNYYLPKYLIPLRTVAHNPGEKKFKRYDIIKVLSCENFPNCGLKNRNLIVTDVGGGRAENADAWLDLFAGIGKTDLNMAKRSKSNYVIVCKVGQTNQNAFR